MKYLYSLLVTVTLLHAGRATASDIVGDTWKLRLPTGTSDDLASIAVNGTTGMVAVGAHGAIVTADAQATWKAATSGVTADLTSVVWSGPQGRYVAVGAGSTVVTSTDAVTWSPAAPLIPVDDQINSVVAVSPTLLVAVGGSSAGAGISFTSTTGGQSWQRHAVAAATTLKGVAFTGSKFIAVATNKVFTSDDGASWTSTPLAATVPTSIAYLSGLSTAVITGTKSWSSINGGPWTLITPPSTDLRISAASATELLGTNSDGEVWSSLDAGKTWQIRLAAQLIQLNAATKFGANDVVVGDAGVIEMTSGTEADALRRQPPLPGIASLASVAVGTPGAVAVGAGGKIVLGTAFDTWAASTSGTSADLARVIWAGNQYVAVGASDTILTSADGSAWATAYHVADANEKLTGVASSGSLIVTVGENRNHNGVALRSADGGATWQSVIVDFPAGAKTINAPPLVDVTWSGSKFVAVANGYVLVSATGVTWTAVALPATLPTRVTTTGSGTVVISGNKSWSSANLNAWTVMTLPALLQMEWAGDSLLGVTSTGDIWQSANDGISWQVIAAAEAKGVALAASARFADGVPGQRHLVAVDKNGGIETFKTSLNCGPVAATTNAVAWNQLGDTDALYVAVGFDTSWTGTVADETRPGEVTWTPHHQGTPSDPFTGVAVVWSPAGQQFVAVGTNIWTSTNGIDWTLKGRGPSTDPSIYTVALMGTKLLAFGYDNARHQVMLATSQDGKGDNWTAFADMPGHQWAMLSAAKADGDFYLAVGWAGRFLISGTGGNDFQEFLLPQAAGEDFTSVIWQSGGAHPEQGRYVAVTSKGSIWNFNGSVWTKASIWKPNATNGWTKSANGLASHSLWCVRRSNMEYIAAGNFGYMLKSFNGQDWREFPPYTTAGGVTSQYINDMLFTTTAGNPIWIAAGGLGTFLSSDGTLDPVRPTLTFSSAAPSFAENGGTVTITATLSKNLFSAPLTFPITISPNHRYKADKTSLTFSPLTASPKDLVQTFTLTGVNDSITQGPQVINIGSSGTTGDLTINSVNVSITDDEPANEVNFTENVSTIGERLASGNSHVITVTMAHAVAKDTVIPLVFSGTATSKNFTKTVASSVTIPKNLLTANFTVTAVNDTLFNADRTVVISIAQPPVSASIGTVKNTHTVTITNDDTLPVISASPVYQLVPVGGPVTFSASVTGGLVDNVAAVYTSQWLKNGAAITGQPAVSHTGSAAAYYPITRTALADAGTYSLTTKSIPGTVTSKSAALGVVDGAPQNATVKAGGSVVLKAAAAGPGLTYQWAKNGAPLSGEVQSTLPVNSVASVASGGDKYICTVTLRQYADNGTTVVQTLSQPAGEITLNIVSGAPVITPPVFGTGAVAEDYAFAPVASPVASLWTISGLPPGLAYSSSTGAISGRPSKAGAYTVTMTASNAVGKSPAVSGKLTISALPAAGAGTFVGTITGEPNVNKGLGGRLDLVTTSSGTFTGKLTDADGATAFSGSLTSGSTDDKRTVSVLVGNKSLNATLTISTGTVAGTVNVGTASTPLTAWRQTAVTVKLSGSYTASLAQGTDTTKGYGYSLFAIAAAGTVNVTGRLSDTTVYTASSVIGPGGQMAVFAAPYLTAGAITGTVAGSLNVTENADVEANAVTGALVWAATSANSRSLIADGGRYRIPVAPHVVMNLTAGPNNAALSFDGADLGPSGNSPNGLFTIKAVATVTGPAGANPASTGLVITPKTGEFTGPFTDLFGTTPGSSRLATFYGVLIRPGGSATMEGRGFFNVPAEDPNASPLTGVVTLKAAP